MQNFTIKKDFYYRQRVGNSVNCSPTAEPPREHAPALEASEACAAVHAVVSGKGRM